MEKSLERNSLFKRRDVEVMKRNESKMFSALWLGAAILGKGTREISIARNIWNLVSSSAPRVKKVSPTKK